MKVLALGQMVHMKDRIRKDKDGNSIACTDLQLLQQPEREGDKLELLEITCDHRDGSGRPPYLAKVELGKQCQIPCQVRVWENKVRLIGA